MCRDPCFRRSGAAAIGVPRLPGASCGPDAHVAAAPLLQKRRKYPAIGQSWRRNWEAVIPFAFPVEGRKIIYTTNAIESLNASVRKAIRHKGHFPNDQAATQLIWLALRHITENWKRPPVAWQAAKAQFALRFGDRFNFND